MAAALNDVVRVTVNQKQAGQTVLNVYHYQVVTLTGLDDGYLEVVRDWMLNEVIPPVLAIQNQALAYHSMLIQNVTNGIDFLEYAWSPPAGGAGTGDVLPPYATYTFRLLRETLATRHGYKRFAGVNEGSQNNGTSLVSAAEIAAIEDALAADIQPAPSIVPLLAPVIVRKDATGAIMAVNNVGGCDFRGIGTQNTRKIGRGS